ncbi:hypothetical protein I302_102581 [Kwoniella bestiolae CBS 10118]|uniref:Uncharacterized protein n=1 Tax=Kwoniella bestiolae CBS 10118 TaxID=1296100 RepID=A0A1B9GFL0_9TREE|nr:hypothetical protein I302_01268 [Kwoniella bestiolae CBS 10118]OCF29755.1 hypothetical protein I302_01268 [Kwoniella bestiolae CBS 10118]
MRFSIAFPVFAFASCTLAAPVAQGFGGNNVNANGIVSGGPAISQGQVAPPPAVTGGSGVGGGALGNAGSPTTSGLGSVLGASGLSGDSGDGIAAGPAGKAAAKPGSASGAIGSQFIGSSQSPAPPFASAFGTVGTTPPAGSPFGSGLGSVLGASGLSGDSGDGIAAGPAGKAAAKPGSASGAIGSQFIGSSQSPAPPFASAFGTVGTTPPAGSPFGSASAGVPPPVQSV